MRLLPASLRARATLLRGYVRLPRQVVRSVTADCCAFGGAALVALGIHEIYGPAGLIFAGLFLLLYGLALSRRPA